MLTRMITTGNTDFNGDGTPEFLPNGVTYGSISLGSLVGSVFTPLESSISTAALNVPGGRLLYLLQSSASIGPSIKAGLASFGLTPGTLLYDLFFMFAQTIADADPMNYIAHAADGSIGNGVATNILVQEAINDPVVPNSSTEDLARAAGLTQLNALVPIAGLAQETIPLTGWQGSGLTQFEGGHATLLDPSQGPTVQVAFQALTFLGTSLFGTPVIVDPAMTVPKGKQGVVDGVQLDFRAFDLEIDPSQLILLPKHR
jgi:hypothetical protein